MHQPLVSVVTPSFNQGHFIERTIKSVVNQSYPNFEYIIMDGGSTDDSLEIIRLYERDYPGVLRWVSEKDSGQANAVNKAFAMCRGAIIGWLNSDDIYFDSDVLSVVVDYFQNNQHAMVVYGDDVLIDSFDQMIRFRRMPNFKRRRILRSGGCISQPATFFRRAIIENHQLDESLDVGIDYEFWLRLSKESEFRHLPRVLAGNRLHSNRKMIARLDEAKRETNQIRRRYGLQKNQPVLLLADKLHAGGRRLSGAMNVLGLKKIDRDALFVYPPESLGELLKTQLIGKADAYALQRESTLGK